MAIIVASSGGDWLRAALRTLRAQGYPRLAVVGVDNASTDDTGEIMRERLGASRVLRLDRNRGFARAVFEALREYTDAKADYVLLVHDDMALMPDAVQWLVRAMEADPRLAIAGPKLREWDEDALLQSVGMSADVFGRAERQLDDGELDQGQHDSRRDTLYVPTAGMMIRADLFNRIGGFDPRFVVFREDMDLCWRAWNTGSRVAVVPEAVGYHVAAAANGLRESMDMSRARYLIERNTLATTIKNYSLRRLAWLLPAGFALAVIRTLALVVARRFGEAFSIIRAYVWNISQLGGTLTRRRVVQTARTRTDKQVGALFAAGLPRLQQYSDSFNELIAGTNTSALIDAEEVERIGIDPLADQPLQRFLRDRPLVLLGVPLLLAFLFSIAPLLGSGPVVGGQITPWPDSAATFLRNYVSPWGAEPLGSASFPSPIQAVFGIVGTVLGGNAWLSGRLLVFGLLPLAFVTTLRAGRLVTSRPWPRVVGATVYVLSPVVLGTLSRGQYGLLVVAALLPAAASLTITTASPQTVRGRAWRSTALLGLTLMLALAAAPIDGLLLVVGVLVGAVTAALRGWWRPLARLLVGLAGAGALLAPWLLDLARNGGPAGGTLANTVGLPATEPLSPWRALLGQPQTVDGLDGVLGFGMLLLPAAVFIGVLFVGMRSRPLITGALCLAVAVAGTLAWLAQWAGVPLLDTTTLLLPGVLALAVLATVVTRWSADLLTAADFGASQVGAAVGVLVGIGGVLAGLGLLTAGPWQSLSLDPTLVPAFIGSEGDEVGQYRVLLLDTDDEGGVTWEITDDDGPDMSEYGTIRDQALTDLINDTVTQISDGVGSGAAATLGVLNIRYVVLLEPDPTLQTALSGQVDLDPLSSQAAVTYQVRTWLPRAGILGQPQADRLLATGDPGPTGPLDITLSQVRPGRYTTDTLDSDRGLLVVSESTSSAWRAVGGGDELQQVEVPAINAFRVEETTFNFTVAVEGGLRRRAVVAGQILVALIVLSLAVRPPGASVREERVTSMPADLVGLADQTMALPKIDPDRPPAGAS
ncbi:glycosyltransferase family 2 protein [Euzebya tangerina]|uniref:glycosyltransferase family 2 protein n=1 Tax=Euzebya tangerina TaxID=591198 RepID=UPI002F2CA4B5